MKSRTAILIGIALLLAHPFALQAQIPKTLAYQGIVTDAASEIKPDGSYSFTFRLYDASSGGTALWVESKTISVKDGLFFTTLGDQVIFPSSLHFDKPYWLSIQVGGEAELSPRVPLTSVGYSFTALRADSARYAWQTPSGGGLTLPYSGTYSGSGIGTFRITNSADATTSNMLYIDNTGQGRVANFNIENNINASTVLRATTDGDGKVCYFRSYNSENDNVVDISSWSNVAAALEVYNAGLADAALFDGNVDIWGTLSKSAGSFKIDHPLDPENKYLYHSFVESPEMMNVYNGNIILNNNGESIVELPEWFEVLNKEFRYQLTCIGGYAPVYIADEISNNSFKISGGTPRMKVSWQVTGVRQDPYANDNRIQVEVEKTNEEKSYYLHYKEYNQPIEKSNTALKNPELLEELYKNK